MALYASRRQLCRYMVEYHHLSAASALHGMEELEGYLRKVGCVQYDPLDVVGRNPCLLYTSPCPLPGRFHPTIRSRCPPGSA